MNCSVLPGYGTFAGFGVLIVVGVVILSTLLLLWFRKPTPGPPGAQVYVPLGLAAMLAGFLVSPPHTPSVECLAGENSVTITQSLTPILVGPGIAPATVTGWVTNNGGDETFITSIEVSLDAVTPAPGSVAGVCDTSDYVLRDTSMPVATMLVPGASSSFAGASLGFSNKSTNQDACKGATVHLNYSVTSR